MYKEAAEREVFFKKFLLPIFVMIPFFKILKLF